MYGGSERGSDRTWASHASSFRVVAQLCHGAARTNARRPHRPKTRTIAGKKRPRIALRKVTRIGTLCLPRKAEA